LDSFVTLETAQELQCIQNQCECCSRLTWSGDGFHKLVQTLNIMHVELEPQNVSENERNAASMKLNTTIYRLNASVTASRSSNIPSARNFFLARHSHSHNRKSAHIQQQRNATMEPTSTDYSKWSAEELITRVTELEKQLREKNST
jgi:hypothetical protein